MAPPDLPSRPKGSPQSDVQEGAPELVKCSKSPEGSQSGANDNPAASSQKGSPRLPPDSSQPDAKDPSKQPLEATTGLEKRGRETGKAPPNGLAKDLQKAPNQAQRTSKKHPEKGALKLGRKRGCTTHVTRGQKALKRYKFQGFLVSGTLAGTLGSGVYRHPFWGRFLGSRGVPA